MNKDLKEKIELLIKGNSYHKENDYYKEQMSEYEMKIIQLEKLI